MTLAGEREPEGSGGRASLVTRDAFEAGIALLLERMTLPDLPFTEASAMTCSRTQLATGFVRCTPTTL
jgi:hypothetical protein